MAIIESMAIPESEAFRRNRAAHLDLIGTFRTLEAKVLAASARAGPKFAKRGQLLPRDRVALLLDRDAPFLELSTLAGIGMHDDDGLENVYGGGAIAGIGFVSGIRAMVFASDAGIKGGPPASATIKMLRDWMTWIFGFGLVGLGGYIDIKELSQAGGTPLKVGLIVGVVKYVLALVVVLLIKEHLVEI